MRTAGKLLLATSADARSRRSANRVAPSRTVKFYPPICFLSGFEQAIRQLRAGSMG